MDYFLLKAVVNAIVAIVAFMAGGELLQRYGASPTNATTVTSTLDILALVLVVASALLITSWVMG